MLRKLSIKDAPYMYEWMQDNNVLTGLSNKFRNMTLSDCENFINRSQNDGLNIHRAIVDAEDQYLGTVSLKNISNTYHSAEFAIVLRSNVIGHGYGKRAMREILNLGFEQYHLDIVFWQVLRSNKRARGFYDYLGYIQTEEVPEYIIRPYGGLHLEKYCWYSVCKK
jgi:diamine N-acetyltransferase